MKNLDMPMLGVGTFRLQDEVAYQSVLDALELGYRHIDTAQIYGNEEAVGNAIKDSGIAREELFVTTKVWNSALNKDKLLKSVHESLGKLQLDYVDLLLVHWPAPEPEVPMSEYLIEMQKAKSQGLTRQIGVSNFTIANLEEALQTMSADEIYTNQFEVHPYLTNTKLREYCVDKGIKITGYMPFAVGKVLSDPVVNEVANNHGVSSAEVAIAWQLAHGMTTIPSSTKKANLASNLKGQSLTLTEQEIVQIDELTRGYRLAAPDFSPQWDEA